MPSHQLSIRRSTSTPVLFATAAVERRGSIIDEPPAFSHSLSQPGLSWMLDDLSE
jgi:hypothetical protein